MLRAQKSHDLSPGQAQYVLERLLADRRITPADVLRYLSDLDRDIAETELRLKTLREASGASVIPANRPASDAPKQPKAARRRKHSAAGRLGLRFSGLIRHLPDAVRAELKKLRASQGVEAAIKGAQAAATK